MQIIAVCPLHYPRKANPGTKKKHYNPVKKQCQMLNVLLWINLQPLKTIEIVLTGTRVKETLLIVNVNNKIK